MSQDISIVTVIELATFLERERLSIRSGRNGSRYSLENRPHWWAVLDKKNDHGIVVATYRGQGEEMSEAIADAIKLMFERRRERPSQSLDRCDSCGATPGSPRGSCSECMGGG